MTTTRRKTFTNATSTGRFLPAIIMVATGAVLFGPTALLERLGLVSLVDRFRAALGLTCLIAAAVVVVAQLIPWAAVALKHRLEKWWQLRRGKKRLHDLTRSEKNLLKQYVTRETRTLVLDASSSATSALLLAGIIHRALELDDKALGLAFNIEEWALGYLKDNRHLLETSEVSSARVRAPIQGQSVTDRGRASGPVG